MSEYTMADYRRERARRTGQPYRPKRPPPPKRRESRAKFVERTVAACRQSLEELAHRSPADVIPCPWGAVFGGECLDPCRCGGKREVTVGFMVAHYRLVLAEFGATP